MNRRDFLNRAMLAAGALAAPELLWTPTKKIFLPLAPLKWKERHGDS